MQVGNVRSCKSVELSVASPCDTLMNLYPYVCTSTIGCKTITFSNFSVNVICGAYFPDVQ